MYNALEIADYVLGYYSFERDINISNLKLQKVLYFLQANHLVITGRPLFVDNIEAWDFGPVIYDVYRKYRIYGGGSIPYNLIDKDREYSQFILSDDRKIISELLNELQDYSATALLSIIHNQKPWKDAYYSQAYEIFDRRYGNWKKIKVIPNKLLYEYFKES
jgi:uncharacterized phage-associated protein